MTKRNRKMRSYTAVLRNVDTGEIIVHTELHYSIDEFTTAMNQEGYVVVDEKVKRTEVFVKLILENIPDELWHPNKVRLTFTEDADETSKV